MRHMIDLICFSINLEHEGNWQNIPGCFTDVCHCPISCRQQHNPASQNFCSVSPNDLQEKELIGGGGMFYLLIKVYKATFFFSSSNLRVKAAKGTLTLSQPSKYSQVLIALFQTIQASIKQPVIPFCLTLYLLFEKN